MDLVPLFRGRDVSGRRLDVELPAGRVIASAETGVPALWLSDEPPTFELWQRLHAAHPESGLWPLVLDPMPVQPDRPWETGELWPVDLAPSQQTANELLAGWWSDNELYRANGADMPWSGASARPAQVGDPDTAAERLAADLLAKAEAASASRVAASLSEHPGLQDVPQEELRQELDQNAWAHFVAGPAVSHELLLPPPRLGLVAVDRGADALTVAGWRGWESLATVLRDWEDRFGARVVAAGFDSLQLSVAAPPADLDQALLTAAEHGAFCRDQLTETSLADYAQTLIGSDRWYFWWD
jgi:hypothetical protein